MQLEEGRHTYYGPNPGAFSLPVRVSWTLPDGYSVSEIVWPAPHRYKEPTGDISYVYEGDVVLDVTLDVPATAALGEVTVGTRVEYQVCKTNCITGSAELTLPLPVVAETQHAREAAWLAPFEHADTHRPVGAGTPWEVASTTSHTPLRPGDVVVAVLDLAAPEGAALAKPKDDS